MNEFIDTHCHIHEASAKLDGEAIVRNKWQAAGFDSALPLIDEAAAVGVSRLICVGCTLVDSKQAVVLAGTNAHCWSSIGIHPHEAKNHLTEETQKAFASLVTAPRVIAIGECGLDYYYNHSPKADQLSLLHFQLGLAQQHKLPVIFHIREAFDEFWPIFDQYTGLRGVIHSFTAEQAVLRKVLDRGLYVGLNGIMTFTKNAEQLAAAKAVPIDKLVLETDAPYLTPTPYRGTICKPKYVQATAEFLANLRKESLVELARATTANARRLFNL